ncbi:hypothetical protein N7G274_008109 [Stereocaulon virgatum]|uniref:BED-type domain-containing protein n=1 Tax=Stereocaulon virgatum TaxID=373712 RepID=A0ABR4A1W9_9LECA
MSDSGLSSAPSSLINTSKNPWSHFTGVSAAVSRASTVSGPNPARNTRGFTQRRPIIPPKPTRKAITKRQRPEDLTENLLEDSQTRELEEEVLDQTNSEEDEFADTQSNKNPFHSTSQSTSRSSSITPYRHRAKRSNIWDYFTTKGSYSRCNYCHVEYKTTGGTRGPRTHLAKDRSIYVVTPKEDRHAQYNENLVKSFSRQPELAKALQERRLEAFQAESLDRTTLEFLHLQWTIPANHESSLIEDKNFRAFLQYISKPANEMLPLSANTIKAKVMILFAEANDALPTCSPQQLLLLISPSTRGRLLIN